MCACNMSRCLYAKAKCTHVCCRLIQKQTTRRCGQHNYRGYEGKTLEKRKDRRTSHAHPEPFTPTAAALNLACKENTHDELEDENKSSCFDVVDVGVKVRISCCQATHASEFLTGRGSDVVTLKSSNDPNELVIALARSPVRRQREGNKGMVSENEKDAVAIVTNR